MRVRMGETSPLGAEGAAGVHRTCAVFCTDRYGGMMWLASIACGTRWLLLVMANMIGMVQAWTHMVLGVWVIHYDTEYTYTSYSRSEHRSRERKVLLTISVTMLVRHILIMLPQSTAQSIHGG